jgi:hypothetical protein
MKKDQRAITEILVALASMPVDHVSQTPPRQLKVMVGSDKDLTTLTMVSHAQKCVSMKSDQGFHAKDSSVASTKSPAGNAQVRTKLPPRF